MLNVRNRRRLAGAVVIVFVVLSAAFTYYTARSYAPNALRRSVQDAFRKAFGYDLSLEGPAVSVRDSVSFAKAAAYLEGREFLSAEKVTVAMLPRPLGGWAPARVEAKDVTVRIDLTDEYGGLGTLNALAGIVERADTSKLALPETISVTVAMDGARATYRAPSKALMDDETLDLAPSAEAPSGWRFTATPSAVTLHAPLAADNAIVKAVLRSAGRSIIAKAENPDDGELTAIWTRDGFRCDFSNQSGWRMPSDMIGDIAAAPSGMTRVTVTALTVNGGAVTDMEGSFEFAGGKVKADDLAQWLAVVALPLLSKDTPAELKNVSAAGNVSLHNGIITVTPAAGKPGLVWRDTGGAPAVIVANGGETRLADFEERIEKRAHE